MSEPKRRDHFLAPPSDPPPGSTIKPEGKRQKRQATVYDAVAGTSLLPSPLSLPVLILSGVSNRPRFLYRLHPLGSSPLPTSRPPFLNTYRRPPRRSPLSAQERTYAVRRIRLLLRE
jgi:hypothetical protein